MLCEFPLMFVDFRRVGGQPWGARVLLLLQAGGGFGFGKSCAARCECCSSQAARKEERKQGIQEAQGSKQARSNESTKRGRKMDAMQSEAYQCNAMQCNGMQWNEMQFNSQTSRQSNANHKQKGNAKQESKAKKARKSKARRSKENQRKASDQQEQVGEQASM
jgi:hypothetical protein